MELEENKIIFASDPEFFKRYHDLVTTQLISADEFCAGYDEKPSQQSANINQEIGVSGSFLSGTFTKTEESTTYNITDEIIDSVFKIYPAVKRKYMKNVPHKISKSEFWLNFFQSHYFSISERLNIKKDIFSKYVKTNEQDIKSAIDKGISNPFLDLTSFEEDNLVDEASKSVVIAKYSEREIHQSMIRCFNHFSMMVLESSAQKETDTNLNDAPDAKKPAIINNSVSQPMNVKIKKAIMEEKTKYTDLESEHRKYPSSLNLSKASQYLSWRNPVVYEDNISPKESINYINASLKAWEPNLPAVLAPAPAVQGISELMPSSSLMKNLDTTHLKDTVPVEIQLEMKQLYCALAELLRQFWSSFSTTAPQAEKKLIDIIASLRGFEYAKLQPFEYKLARNCLSPQLCEHMRSLLQSAFKKFSNFQSRFADKSLSLNL